MAPTASVGGRPAPKGSDQLALHAADMKPRQSSRPAPRIFSSPRQRQASRARATRHLLRAPPGIRPRQLDGHIREENVQRPTVGRSAVIQREEQRSGLLVVSPGRNDNPELPGSPAMIDEFPDSAVGADVEFPSIARRIAARGRIFHHDLLGGTLPQRQFLPAGIFHRGAGVPNDMERKEQPILIPVFIASLRKVCARMGASRRRRSRQKTCPGFGLQAGLSQSAAYRFFRARFPARRTRRRRPSGRGQRR